MACSLFWCILFFQELLNACITIDNIGKYVLRFDFFKFPFPGIIQILGYSWVGQNVEYVKKFTRGTLKQKGFDLKDTAGVEIDTSFSCPLTQNYLELYVLCKIIPLYVSNATSKLLFCTFVHFQINTLQNGFVDSFHLLSLFMNVTKIGKKGKNETNPLHLKLHVDKFFQQKIK